MERQEVSHILCVYVCMCVALDIRRVNRIFSAPYCIVTCALQLTLLVLSTLSRKRHDFRGKKKFIEHKTRVLIFFTILSDMFLIIRTIQGDMIINLCGVSCKVPVILVRF